MSNSDEQAPVKNEELSGSCLCGAVSYTIKGQAEKFYHCHCKRCRKATGTGHASNIIMTGVDSFSWNSGADQVGRYKVADAKRFETVFCTQCGSSLPRVPDDKSYGVLPVGTLDEEPHIKPQARIFVGSRTNWSCSSNGSLPEFDRYPE